MVFYPMPWTPKLPEVPDTVPLHDFMLDEQYGRYPIAKSRPAYTSGLSGEAVSIQDVKERVEFLAKALHKELGWSVNGGSEYDKVAGIYALNTVCKFCFTCAPEAYFPRLIL